MNNLNRLTLSVAEAAARLEVNQSRVRALIAAGLLQAERVGGRWLLDVGSLERYQRERVARGRMFAPRQAWGILMLAADIKPWWLCASEISRLRRVLREQSLETLARRLGRRAERLFLYAHPADLSRLLAERLAVRTGLSAPERHQLALSGPDRGKVEIYYPASGITQLRNNYSLQSLSPPNVLLRVINTAWPFAEGIVIAPDSVIAIDLLESDDARTRRAGLELLNRGENK